MKKILFGLLSVFIAFTIMMLPGCNTQSGTSNSTINSTNNTSEYSLLMFYDPSLPPGVNNIIFTLFNSTKADLPSLNYEIHCIDIQYLQKGTPGPSEQICIQQYGEKEYAKSIALAKNISLSSFFVLRNGNKYIPINYVPVKLAFEKQICDNLNDSLSDCNDLPVLPTLTAILIYDNSTQPQPDYVPAVESALNKTGIPITIDLLSYPSPEAKQLIDEYNVSYIPVLLINATDANKDQSDLLYSQFGNPINSVYVWDMSNALKVIPTYVGKKSDEVTLDIYVMSHCPFGLQMQKAVIPVAKLFENVSNVHINNKFVNYIMHGPIELEDNLYEYCIDKEFPDKFWDFLACFIESHGNKTKCMEEQGIDATVVEACINETKSQYSFENNAFPIYNEENGMYGVRGSPTVVLNGRTVIISRTPEAVKEAICNRLAEPPAECNVSLAGYNIMPGFGPINASTSSSSSGRCG